VGYGPKDSWIACIRSESTHSGSAAPIRYLPLFSGNSMSTAHNMIARMTAMLVASSGEGKPPGSR
jgi:hypothetical protein